MRSGDQDDLDNFHPPADVVDVCCMHCGETYPSSLIEWRAGAGPPGYAGAWCCPTPGCGGVGFLFDIWPADPDWTDEDGNRTCFFDNEDDEDFDDFDEAWSDEEEEDEEPWAESVWGEGGRFEPEDDREAWKGEDSPTGEARPFNDDDIPF